MPKSVRRRESPGMGAWLVSEESTPIMDAILRSTPSIALIASAPDDTIVRHSDYAMRLTGFSRAEIEGRPASELADKLQLCDVTGRRLAPDEFPLVRALQGETVVDFDGWFTHARGEPVPFGSSAAPTHSDGKRIGAIGCMTDLRSYRALEQGLRETLDQREILYRELTCRVKSHLHLMSSLIRFEAHDPDLSAVDLAKQMGARFQTLAAVYDGMTRAGAGAGAGARTAIEARPFVEAICRPYRSEAVALCVSAEPADTTLTSDQAGPLGILLNEAVANSVKHAFPGRRGQIWVTLSRVGLTGLHVEINDNGVGLKTRAARARSQGLALMRLLVEELHGAFLLTNRPGGGARVIVDLPDAI